MKIVLDIFSICSILVIDAYYVRWAQLCSSKFIVTDDEKHPTTMGCSESTSPKTASPDDALEDASVDCPTHDCWPYVIFSKPAAPLRPSRGARSETPANSGLPMRSSKCSKTWVWTRLSTPGAERGYAMSWL